MIWCIYFEKHEHRLKESKGQPCLGWSQLQSHCNYCTLCRRRHTRQLHLHGFSSWYQMGSRQSSIMGSSAQIIRHNSVSILLCVLFVALGPIQFGFTCGYSSPKQSKIISDLRLSLSEFSVFRFVVKCEGHGWGNSQ